MFHIQLFIKLCKIQNIKPDSINLQPEVFESLIRDAITDALLAHFSQKRITMATEVLGKKDSSHCAAPFKGPRLALCVASETTEIQAHSQLCHAMR